MATRSYTPVITVTFGLLVVVFSVVLLLVLRSALISHTDFMFSISRLAVSIFLFAFVALFAVTVVLFTRALRRHR